MRRFSMTVAIALIAACFFAPPTFAKIVKFRGDAGPGSVVSFSAKIDYGRIVKVSGFHWKGVPIVCNGSESLDTEYIDIGTLVDEGRFRDSFRDTNLPPPYTFVRGEFQSFTEASGTLRTYGEECGTGLVNWTAARL